MARVNISVPGGLGPAFGEEVRAAGLGGLRIRWARIECSYDDDPGSNGLTPAQAVTLQATIDAHNPATPATDADGEMRDAVVAYAASLQGMNRAQREAAVSTQQFGNFLNAIATLGAEGL